MFDGKRYQVNTFQDNIKNRSYNYRFNAIIMKVRDDNIVSQNTITEHGLLTKYIIMNWVAANVINQKTKAAQDNGMLYQFLFDLVSEDVKKCLMFKAVDYEVIDTKIDALYNKVVIRTFEVETRASVEFVRKNLMNLKANMEDLNYNVPDFHIYTKEQINSLSGYVNTSEYFTTHLPSEYGSVPDEDFHDILIRKKFSFFWSGLQCPKAYSLWGGVVPSPSIG